MILVILFYFLLAISLTLIEIPKCFISRFFFFEGFSLVSDWYLWFPLYAMACLVNMVNGVPKVTKTAKIALLMGIILFLKVVIEDVRFHQGITGLWSFDMRERVVREKLGSGLVILSMSLQLLKSDTNNPSLANHVEFGNFPKSLFSFFGLILIWVLVLAFYFIVHLFCIAGQSILVAIGYGLSFAFLLFSRPEMKF